MISPGELRKLARPPAVQVETQIDSLDDAELSRRVHIAAHLKRFFECFLGDPEFRDAVRQDPETALAARGLDVETADAQAFLALNDPSPAGEPRSTPNLGYYRDLLLQFQGGQELVALASATRNARYSAWRQRQLARLRFEFSAVGDFVVRPSAAYELSRGCTAGCWFCAISAERFTGNFDYPSHAPLWRGVLEAMKAVLGDSAGSGFCYWATDSLDNPHYESFALDAQTILGHFPATTTALSLRNVARTKALLALSQRNGCRLNRFSVLTLPMLKRIHREFTAEELFLVELVLHNPGALMFFPGFPHTAPGVKIRAGRLMEDPLLAPSKNVPVSDGSIACIVGFLSNMVERSIQLVSPCRASSEWPLGYRIHDVRRFDSAEDFRAQIESMIDRHMPVSIPPDFPLRFLPGLDCALLADGFRVSTPMHAVEFRGGFEMLKGLLFKELAHVMRAGGRRASEMESSGFLGMPPEAIRAALNEILASGALDDSPQTPAVVPLPVIAPAPAVTHMGATIAHMEGLNT